MKEEISHMYDCVQMTQIEKGQKEGIKGGWHNQNPPTHAGHDWSLVVLIFLPRNLDL